MSMRRDRLRAAAQLQKELREVHGDGADAILEEHVARSGRNRAEQTYRQAMARNSGLRFRAADATLPQHLLDPAETVYEVAVGAQRQDSFPLLIVTDRRVIHTRDTMLRGWRILQEAPAGEVRGAELGSGMLTAVLRVRLADGSDITMKTLERERAGQVAELLAHLAAGGAPPAV